MEFESTLKMQTISDTLSQLQDDRDALLASLEAQKIGASPSKIKEIEKQIAELQEKAERSEKINNLTDMISMGLNDFTENIKKKDFL